MVVRKLVEALDKNSALALEIGPVRVRATGIVGIIAALIAVLLAGLFA